MASPATMPPPNGAATVTPTASKSRRSVTTKTPSQASDVRPEVRMLARKVAFAFYGSLQYLVMDLLVRHPCVKEDDIRDKLKMDPKTLRLFLTSFKNDHFLLERTLVEASGASLQRKSYYAVDYAMLCNVTKYRLDLMRKGMENEQKIASSHAAFRCEKCKKKFEALDINQLITPGSTDLVCSYCGGNVVEDDAGLPGEQQRAKVSEFNRIIHPIQSILLAIDKLELSVEEMQPDPFAALKQQDADSTQNFMQMMGGQQYGGRSGLHNGIYRPGGIVDGDNSNLVILYDGDDDGNVKKAKPLPEWSINSTIAGKRGAYGSPTTNYGNTNSLRKTALMNDAKQQAAASSPSSSTAPPATTIDGVPSSLINNVTITTGSGRRRPVEDAHTKIINMLHQFESRDKSHNLLGRKSLPANSNQRHSSTGSSGTNSSSSGPVSDSSVGAASVASPGRDSSGSRGLANGNTTMVNGHDHDTDKQHHVADLITVMVNGRAYALTEVDDNIISQMSAAELADYNRVAVDVYAKLVE